MEEPRKRQIDKEQLEKLLKAIEFTIKRAKSLKENSTNHYPVGFNGGA